MKIMNEDEKNIVHSEYIEWKLLENKSIFITGAAGLIGSRLVKILLAASECYGLNMRILAFVHNSDKAKRLFKEEKDSEQLHIIEGDVSDMPMILEPIDYIIHAASCTSSKDFVQKPVEVIKTSVIGTAKLLDLAKEKNVRGFVYLSSMEVYGYPEKGHKIKENEVGAFSLLQVRSSYPLSKQLCENLCRSYYDEYDVPVRIARLTQTFGPGVNIDQDSRIFAYFARCLLNKEDIILKTEGKTERCYCYIEDAVAAILVLLLKGVNGEAYNVACSETYCSVFEMAKMVADYAGVKVKFDFEDNNMHGFTDTHYMDLDTRKLESLGWEPKEKKLLNFFIKMIEAEKICPTKS